MRTLGLDSGSTMTKGVVFDGMELICRELELTTEKPGQVLRQMYERLYTPEVCRTIATGYGRELLPEADKAVTEITCHAMGAAWLAPECRAVIDVGGQDSKVMLIDENGRVTDFLMNDKCAAGTGRFLEMMMNRVNSDIRELDTFVQGCTPEKINSMCAVFAESEVIGLLAREKDPGDIILGCLHSICRRTAVFARKLIRTDQPVFFSGGLAGSRAIREILGGYLAPAPLVTHPLSQFAGAAGAAILGYRSCCRNGNSIRQ